MPTVQYEDRDNGITLSIDFQMWCAVCGKGICSNTHYRRRTINEFETQCPTCQANLEDARSEADQLRNELSDAESKIDDLEFQIKELEERLRRS